MDRVSPETTPARVAFEPDKVATPQVEPLPSPLAEKAARAQNNGRHSERIAKSRRSRSSRPANSSRLHPRGTKRRSLSPGEVVVGTLAGINDDGQPLVRHPLDPSGRAALARTAVPISPEQVDREIVLAFESGNIERPILLGVLCRPDGQDHAEGPIAPPTIRQPIVQATLDGVQLVLTGEQEIVLRCGEASLTLTREGKILIRGTYLLSRSSGVNRIKGASVQLN
jgi:hypothetical protein